MSDQQKPTLGESVFLKKGTSVRCPNFKCRITIGILMRDIRFKDIINIPGTLIFELPTGEGVVRRDYICHKCGSPWARWQVYTDDGWKGG